MGGGYLNHNKKNYSERRNHGLSLTNLTHCISPSEYYNDYYNNDSFNKINLQLHASSKVSNPYSFSIKSNTSFSASIESKLPVKDTILRAFRVDDYNQTESAIVVIPDGVKVIKVYSYCNNDNSERTYYSLSTGTWPNDKNWGSVSLNDLVTNRTRYIGVTPGKSYTVTAEISSDSAKGFYGYSRIYYSTEINTHTPNIKDY